MELHNAPTDSYFALWNGSLLFYRASKNHFTFFGFPFGEGPTPTFSPCALVELVPSPITCLCMWSRTQPHSTFHFPFNRDWFRDGHTSRFRALAIRFGILFKLMEYEMLFEYTITVIWSWNFSSHLSTTWSMLV